MNVDEIDVEENEISTSEIMKTMETFQSKLQR